MPTVSLRARDLSWVADELDPKYAKIFERVLSDKDIQEIVQTFEKTGNLADTSKKTGFDILEIADTIRLQSGNAPSNLFSAKEVTLLKKCRAIQFRKMLARDVPKTSSQKNVEYNDGHHTSQDLLEVSLSEDQAAWYAQNYFEIDRRIDNIFRRTNVPSFKTEFVKTVAIDLLLQRLERGKLPQALLENATENIGLLDNVLKFCILDARARESGSNLDSERYRGFKMDPLSSDRQSADFTRASAEDLYPSNHDFTGDLEIILQQIREKIETTSKFDRQERTNLARLKFLFEGYTLKETAEFFAMPEANMYQWASATLAKIQIEAQSPIFERPEPVMPMTGMPIL
jgi:hypothetical protein